MFSAQYQPWHIIENVHVATMMDGNPADIIIPWISAKNVQALAVTAEIVAGFTAVQLKKVIMETKRQKQRVIETVRVDGYQPPLVRFACSSCKDSWDAWVDEDGNLEDPRDALCGTPNCERLGRPAIKVEEERG